MGALRLMGVRRPPALLVGLLVTAALLAGCASTKTHAAAGGAIGAGAGTSAAPDSTYCPDTDMVHLPKHVGTVSAAYVCRTERRRVDGDGKWEFLVVRKVTGGLDHLLDVYATCSPVVRETREVVDAVLRNGRAERIDVRAALGDVPDLGDGPDAQLWPHLHGTDAMYLAALRRT